MTMLAVAKRPLPQADILQATALKLDIYPYCAAKFKRL